MKTSEVAKEVIALSEAIQDYWEEELPKRHRDYPFVHPGEDSGPPPIQEEELRKLLDNLEEDEIYKLALIMHLGRGDFGADDLMERYKALKETFRKPEIVAMQMLEKAPLADYLSDGLAELQRCGLDVDDLTLRAAGTGN